MRLEHELLVKLADPGFAIAEIHREAAAVDYRPGVVQRVQARAGQREQHPVCLVPVDASAQASEQVARVLSGDQLQNAVEARPLKRVVGVRAEHELVQVVRGPVLHRHRRHDLLRQHVQRVLRRVHLLHFAAHHPAGYDRRLQQVLVVRGV